MNKNMNDQYYAYGKLLVNSGLPEVFENNAEGHAALMGFLTKSAEDYFGEPSNVNFELLRKKGTKYILEML